MKKSLVHTGIVFATICLVAVFSTSAFASHQRELLWDQSFKANESIPVVQEKVFKALDTSIASLARTIDAQVQMGEAQVDDDFTLNGTIAYRYDYVMYRIYELMKLDNKIREELASGEKALVAGITPVSVIQRHQAVAVEYTQRMSTFAESLTGIKQVVQIKNLREELRTLQHSLTGVRATASLIQDMPSKPIQSARVDMTTR